MLDRETRNLKDIEENEDLIRRGVFAIHYVRENLVLNQDSCDSDFLMRDITGAIERRIKNPFYRGRFYWRGELYNGKHELFIPQDLIKKIETMKGMTIQEHKEALDHVVSNPIINDVNIQFSLRKPFGVFTLHCIKH